MAGLLDSRPLLMLPKSTLCHLSSVESCLSLHLLLQVDFSLASKPISYSYSTARFGHCLSLASEQVYLLVFLGSGKISKGTEAMNGKRGSDAVKVSPGFILIIVYDLVCMFSNWKKLSVSVGFELIIQTRIRQNQLFSWNLFEIVYLF